MNSNVIRTFIPGGTTPSQATIDAIVEFVQICKAHNQKAIISLFDGYSGFPAAGTAEEAANLALIDAVCGALRNDTGVFAWDVEERAHWISNEYWSWSLPGAEAKGPGGSTGCTGGTPTGFRQAARTTWSPSA